MFWSKTFIPTLKQAPQDAESTSHKLLFRSGMIRMLTSGVYIYLPLGLRVLERIEQIIREEMNNIGAQELLLSCIQPLELWKKTGRDQQLAEIMIRFQDRRGRNLCLGPTHEEVITDLVKNHISSYRQLPLVLYQIQTKFRDEIRPRFGLIRACEFVMKDAYSFDRDQEGLEKNYKLMFDAYKRIFKRCGIDSLITEADPGVMGGSISHEFMVPADSGEDMVLHCKKCKITKTFGQEGKEEKCPKCNSQLEQKETIEVGHIFQLGTKYSKQLRATFLDENGKDQPCIMGCYGIGINRIMASAIETGNDENGIIWPISIAPFQVLVTCVNHNDEQVVQTAEQIYAQLRSANIDVLLDDRSDRGGVKFKDADLIGIPVRITVGKRGLDDGVVEIKLRRAAQKETVPPDQAPARAQELVQTLYAELREKGKRFSI